MTYFGRGKAEAGIGLLPSQKLTKALAFGLVAASFSGCALKRSGYDVPEISLPVQYKNAAIEDTKILPNSPVEIAAKSVSGDFSQDVGMIEWWRSFGNAELMALIDRGIANNLDVRIATLKIAQVKARADQARADQVPAVSANVGESIQAPGGQVGSVPVTVENNKITQKLYQASLRGNWRIDLWGEQSALAESASLQVWQAAFERDNVQRSMVANLASTYVEYLSLNDRLRIAQEADTVLSGVLATIEKRVEAGDATLIELEQQKATIFAVRATIPELEQRREDAVTSIAFLVGAVPGSLALSNNGLNALLLPSIVPSLPSSLILRRPDVRMVEAKLLAADADVDVARARILPPLDLSGQIGYSSLAMSGLFQPLSLFWNTIANLTVSIFDSGKLSSQKDMAKTQHEEMVENYARTIYQAVREVESALAAIRLTAKRFDAQQEATAAAQRAWDSSNEVYAVGGLDHLTLLDAGRTYLRYLDDYERIKMDRYRGYISLFQALGGGADFGQVIPGKGVRPTPVRESFYAAASTPLIKKPSSADGVQWEAGQSIVDGAVWRVEQFWQVELPGLYHRVAIGPTWRDLRARYPLLMEGRIVRPRLNGRIEDSVDGQASWYRLYVAKFPTPVAAEALCTALKASYQRCRVISSISDDTVVTEVAALISESIHEKAKAEHPLHEEKPLAASVETPATAVASAPVPIEMPSAEFAAPVAVSAEAGGGISATDSVSVAQPAASITVAPVMEPAAEATAPVAAPVIAPSRNRPDLSAPPEFATGAPKEKVAYTVQLGTFSNIENAAISHAFWLLRKLDVYVSEFKDSDGRNWYAVRAGVFPQRSDASVAAASLRRKESAPAVMVPIMVDKSGKPLVIALDDLKSPSAAPVLPEPPEAPIAVSDINKSASPIVSESGKGSFAYSVQLGAFSVPENAAVSFAFWQGKGYEVFVTGIMGVEGRMWYAVRTGIYLRRDDALASALFFGRGEDVPVVVVTTPVDKSGVPNTLDIGKRIGRVHAQQDTATVLSAEKAVVAEHRVVRKTFAIKQEQGKPAYSIQLGVFSSMENAAKSLSEWQGRGYDAYVCEIEDAVKPVVRYAVRTGAFSQRRDAAGSLRTLQREGKIRAMLVPAILNRFGRLAILDVAEFKQAAGAEN